MLIDNYNGARGTRTVYARPATRGDYKPRQPHIVRDVVLPILGSVISETLKRANNRKPKPENPRKRKRTAPKTQIEIAEDTQGYSRRMPPKTYPGTFGGRFRRAKRKPNIYNGVVFKREDGFNLADDDGTQLPGALTSPTGCVWTGVSALVWSQFPRNILLAILRKLCASKGFEFNSADDRIDDTLGGSFAPNSGEFHYIYTSSGTVDPVHRVVQIVTHNTWEQLALDWLNDIAGHIGEYADIQFQKCFIQPRVDNASDNARILQSVMALNMIDMKISYTATHTMFIQNRTRDTGGGDTTDAVDTNPLMGRIYVVGNSYLKSNLIAATGDQWGVANDNSGRFEIHPQRWTVNSDQQQLFSRVVPKSAFSDCYKVANIKLQPGEIKKASVTKSDKMSFDRLFFLAFMPGLATNWDFPIRYGKSMVMGFQKVVRTAAVDSQTAYDSRIQLACTTRQYLRVEAHPKRKAAFIARNVQPEVA